MMQLRQFKPLLSTLLVILTTYFLSGCGAGTSGESATNEWVVTNKDSQKPSTTHSVITASGLVVFAGLQSQDSERKTLLTALNLNGEIAWEAAEQQNKGHQDITEKNGHIIVAGGTATAEDYREDFSAPYVERYDNAGNLDWATTMGEFNYDGLLVRSDANNNVYLLTYEWVRRTNSTSYDMHFSLSKLASNGTLESQTLFVHEYQSREPFFQVDSQGNSYIALMNSSPEVFKYNSQGTEEWRREIATDDGAITWIADFVVDQFDRVILHTPIYTEVIPTFIPPMNGLTIAFESNGDVAWEFKEPNPATDYKLEVTPQGITLDANGNIYLTHRSDRQDASVPCWGCEIRSYQLYITKLTADGAMIWQNVIKTDGDGGKYISVNNDYLLVSDNKTFRTFNTSDGSLVIGQDVTDIDRSVSQAYIAEDNSMYFITNADFGSPRFYSLEKWVKAN